MFHKSYLLDCLIVKSLFKKCLSDTSFLASDKLKRFSNLESSMYPKKTFFVFPVTLIWLLYPSVLREAVVISICSASTEFHFLIRHKMKMKKTF